ncbi:sulfite oxidase [Lapillicoccus sp.]|uniref:sulfite oxidase n=1 Tax=Lapillicoccus sp. TaxID=1909287 RepID=UPI00326504C3
MNQWGKRDDMLVHETEPFNAEPSPVALARAVITDVDTFYSRNHGPVPDVDPDAWRLTVVGLVDQPLTLSLAELRERFEQHSLLATLQCAGNRRSGFLKVRDIPGEDPWESGATSTARWTGVRLADVLLAAGIRPEAAHVAFAAPDRSELADPPQTYGGSIPAAKALSGETLLAWAMNDEPLTPLHGAPVRVVVPGWIGARSVKWVERITVQAEPSDNYFQATAYRVLPPDADPRQAGPGDGISLGAVALNSAILEPADGAQVTAGKLDVTGYAFAGDDRGVARVDVSVDGGETWSQADLVAQPSPWAWCQWRANVQVEAGQVEIVARAWDTTAALQQESARELWNPKGYVNNSWPRIHVHST